jgi:Rps23 Pro-64 3,4-dihydroxylase Tpa1-like proline 4-hydroxylase
MRIIDNFLSEQQLNDLKLSIQQDIETHGGQFERYEDEQDHHQTDNCNLYYLNHKTKKLYFELMVEKGLFLSTVLNKDEFDFTLRYHEMRSPYNSTWHRDRTVDWNGNDIDYIGVSYFVHDKWCFEDGGLFLFKQDTESDTGTYVEPISNRIIINDEDLYHSVTQITNPDVRRQSLQLFIHTKYLNL